MNYPNSTTEEELELKRVKECDLVRVMRRYEVTVRNENSLRFADNKTDNQAAA